MTQFVVLTKMLNIQGFTRSLEKIIKVYVTSQKNRKSYVAPTVHEKKSWNFIFSISGLITPNNLSFIYIRHTIMELELLDYCTLRHNHATRVSVESVKILHFSNIS